MSATIASGLIVLCVLSLYRYFNTYDNTDKKRTNNAIIKSSPQKNPDSKNLINENSQKKGVLVLRKMPIKIIDVFEQSYFSYMTFLKKAYHKTRLKFADEERKFLALKNKLQFHEKFHEDLTYEDLQAIENQDFKRRYKETQKIIKNILKISTNVSKKNLEKLDSKDLHKMHIKLVKQDYEMRAKEEKIKQETEKITMYKELIFYRIQYLSVLKINIGIPLTAFDSKNIKKMNLEELIKLEEKLRLSQEKFEKMQPNIILSQNSKNKRSIESITNKFIREIFDKINMYTNKQTIIEQSKRMLKRRKIEEYPLIHTDKIHEWAKYLGQSNSDIIEDLKQASIKISNAKEQLEQLSEPYPPYISFKPQ